MENTIKQLDELKKQLKKEVENIIGMKVEVCYKLTENTNLGNGQKKGYFLLKDKARTLKMEQLKVEDEQFKLLIERVKKKESAILIPKEKKAYSIELFCKGAEKVKIKINWLGIKKEVTGITSMKDREIKELHKTIEGQTIDEEKKAWLKKNQLLRMFGRGRADQEWMDYNTEKCSLLLKELKEAEKILEKKINILMKKYNKESNRVRRQGDAVYEY